MSLFGIGVHVIIALFFAIHVIRSGQQLFWLFVLFSFPLLGSIVYFVAIYLPQSRLQHGARKVVSVAARSLDPTRELRDAREAFAFTPTAQNRIRLAKALLEDGKTEEAAQTFEACLSGPFASDLEIRLLATETWLAAGDAGRALEHLVFIRETNANFRTEQIAVLFGRAYALSGRNDDAKTEFEVAATQFGSFTSRAEYAIFAAGSGDRELAARLRGDVDRTMQRWDRSTRDLNMPIIRRLKEAFDRMK